MEFPVSLTMFSGTERQQWDAHSRDLSEAGIGVLIASELPIGEVAALNFKLPGSKEAWDVRAVLRHRRGYHYGFEFLSLTEQQSQALTKYLPSQHRADGDSGASLRDEEAPAAPK